MAGAGRSLLLSALLLAALGALVVLVASLQAPIPGGGSGGSGDSGTAGSTGSGPGAGEGGGSGGGGGIDPCAPSSTSAASTGAASFLLAPLPLARGRRAMPFLCLGLVALAAGCTVDCTSGGGGDVQLEGGGGGAGGGGGGGGSSGDGGGGGSAGSGGGRGGGDGPGTGEGTAPDPPRIDPRALWILLVVLGAVLLVALLVSLLSARRRRAAASGAAVDADAAPPLQVLAADATASEETRDVVAAYLRACAALAARGVRREPWETAREFAQRVPAGARDPMVRLTRMYEAARHGGMRPELRAVMDARGLARQVETAEPGPEVRPSG